MGKAMKTLSPPVEVAITRKATLLECLLAAVASGALLAFALPPFDVPLLGFVALAPMMAAVLRASAIPRAGQHAADGHRGRHGDDCVPVGRRRRLR
jgi:hypothetical protein